MGILYIVGTPIGNLEDISLRAIETLKSVDYILAEDTRVTSILLKKYGIDKKTKSYYKDIETKKKNEIIKDLKEGKNIALVSDAGMPTISDPGAIIVNEAIKENIKIITIPGANAALTAYASSGFLGGKFIFYGFMKNINELQDIMYNRYPTILYESPNRIKNVLEKINEIDEKRNLVLGRELTKIYEEYYYGTASKILEEVNEKGEMVLIIEGAKEIDLKEDNISFKDAYEFYLRKGLSKKDIIKAISKDFNIPKNEVYKEFTND